MFRIIARELLSNIKTDRVDMFKHTVVNNRCGITGGALGEDTGFLDMHGNPIHRWHIVMKKKPLPFRGKIPPVTVWEAFAIRREQLTSRISNPTEYVIIKEGEKTSHRRLTSDVVVVGFVTYGSYPSNYNYQCWGKPDETREILGVDDTTPLISPPKVPKIKKVTPPPKGVIDY